jgi:type I restriction enzyme M protein
MDNATSALAKMNMILHDNPTATIWKDNTLSTPHFKDSSNSGLKTFDFVVANFPFSTKAWSNGFNPAEDLYGRFEDGIPPQKNGDYAFLLHILKSMKSTGKGAVILPHGVLFRGGAEGEIRKNLIRRGVIKGIIGLPANLFYGTGIPACILVLDKDEAAGRAAKGGGIFMLDASKGFVKDGNKNRLRHQDIHKIVDVFNRQLEVPKYARLVPLAEISDPKNDYNLNIPRYIDNTEEEDIQDIAAHLLGGIPNRDLDSLAHYWDVFPRLRQELFMDADRPGYSQINIPSAQIKSHIFTHAEFIAFQARVTDLLAAWKAKARQQLTGLSADTHPRALIDALSEDLLAAFAVETQHIASLLVDKYNLYQQLMTYWVETMQDDVYLVTADGWVGASGLRRVAEEEGKGKEKPDLVVGKLKLKADLIPPSLIVARYFAGEQHALEGLQADLDALTAQLDDLRETHGGDDPSTGSGQDGLLAEVTEKDKIRKDAVIKRLNEIGQAAEFAEERAVLESYLSLIEREAETKKRLKEAQNALNELIVAQYSQLSEADVRALVVDDKWLAALSASLQGELDRISQNLAARLKELAERYTAPLPALTADVDALSARVEAHLQKMGFIWK